MQLNLVFRSIFLPVSKKFFTTLFTIILGFSCNTTLAKEVPVNEETYRLCSKFPHNSKCEGIEAPVSLEEREGGKTFCQIRWSDIQKLQACKFIVQDNTIKVYLETGKKLNLLDCLLYTSPSPRDLSTSRMPSSA